MTATLPEHSVTMLGCIKDFVAARYTFEMQCWCAQFQQTHGYGKKCPVCCTRNAITIIAEYDPEGLPDDVVLCADCRKPVFIDDGGLRFGEDGGMEMVCASCQAIAAALRVLDGVRPS